MGDIIQYVISISIDREDEEKHDIKEIVEDALEDRGIYGRVSIVQRASI